MNMKKLKGALASKTIWKDFLLFAAPALLTALPPTEQFVRDIVTSVVANHPIMGGLGLFVVGFILRWVTKSDLAEK